MATFKNLALIELLQSSLLWDQQHAENTISQTSTITAPKSGTNCCRPADTTGQAYSVFVYFVYRLLPPV